MKAGFRPIIAARHLRATDVRMAELINKVGKCRLQTNDSLSPFQTLLRSIIYQKIAGHAASAIYSRVQRHFVDPLAMQPEEVLALRQSALLEAGLSRAKLEAVVDLATKSLEGIVPTIDEANHMSDAQLIEQVTQVRGIGRWTVEMMLIYRLGRPDVLPVGDFAVRKGYQLAYRRREAPTPGRLMSIGQKWAPHRSVASWYLWRATDSVDWSL